MPQWFCWYSRSGCCGWRRTVCGSWPYSGFGSGRKSAAQPGVEGRPVVAAVDRLEHAAAGEARGRGGARSRGSTITEWSIEPSGVPSTSGHSAHSPQRGWSFQPATGAQVSPWSSLRNRPCGEPPAYQEPGSSAWPGVSQNTALRERPWASPSGEGRGLGTPPASEAEVAASGTRWGRGGPVRHAARRVAPSRGSSTRCWMMWPRNIGPAAAQARRAASLARSQAPLRVPTRSLGPSRSAGIASPAGSHSGRPNAAVESIVSVMAAA